MRRVLLSLMLVTALAEGASAAPPAVTCLFPGGGRRGMTVDVTATGTFERWPVQAWASDKGITVKPGKDKGKLSLAIAADVAPGRHWLRLHDDQGASTLRPFIVGTLPELLEIEPNDEPGKYQNIARLPVVVNGRLAKPGDVDGFSMKLTKGQTLIAALEAHAVLGSPMDGVLQVLSERGSVLEENNDYRGLDPQVSFRAPADGTYTVRVFAFPATPDATIRFAGAETFVYRLTLTTGGAIEQAFPLAVPRAAPGQIELIGGNIPDGLRRMAVPASESDLVTLFHPDLAGLASVRLEPHTAIVEREPNDRMRPQPIELPVTVSGRIEPAGDVDAYRFNAKKGQPVHFRLESRSLGSPLDAVLLLRDATGKMVSRANDPEGKDVELAFTAPQDGPYQLEVTDLADNGSPRHLYRLRATFPQPDFDLSLTADQLLIEPGKPAKLAITVDKRHGLADDVELSIVGLPTGITMAPSIAKGPGKVMAELTLNAAPAAASGDVRIVGTTKGARTIQRTAHAPAVGVNAVTSHIWLGRGKPAPAPAKK